MGEGCAEGVGGVMGGREVDVKIYCGVADKQAKEFMRSFLHSRKWLMRVEGNVSSLFWLRQW